MRLSTVMVTLGVFVGAAIIFVVVRDHRGGDRHAVLAATHSIGVQAVQTEDGGAACVLREPRLVCANLVTQAKRPPVALLLDAQGSASAIDADLRWSEQTPVLRAGQREQLGAYSCSVRASQQLVCSAATGSAIGVDAAHLSVTVAPATYP